MKEEEYRGLDKASLSAPKGTAVHVPTAYISSQPLQAV